MNCTSPPAGWGRRSGKAGPLRCGEVRGGLVGPAGTQPPPPGALTARRASVPSRPQTTPLRSPGAGGDDNPGQPGFLRPADGGQTAYRPTAARRRNRYIAHSQSCRYAALVTDLHVRAAAAGGGGGGGGRGAMTGCPTIRNTRRRLIRHLSAVMPRHVICQRRRPCRHVPPARLGAAPVMP